MPQFRPKAVLVIAILHLVGGGLGMLCNVCAGIGVAAGPGASTPFGAGGTTAESRAEDRAEEEFDKDYEAGLERELPAKKAFDIAELGIGLVLALMLLAAGLGLLFMQTWARTLSIVYAVLSILEKLVGAVYALKAIGIQNQLLPEVAARHPEVSEQTLSLTRLGILGGPAIDFLFIIYPIVVLLIMFRPHIVAAFRRESGDRPAADSQEEGWGRADDVRGTSERDDRYQAGDRWDS